MQSSPDKNLLKSLLFGEERGEEVRFHVEVGNVFLLEQYFETERCSEEGPPFFRGNANEKTKQFQEVCIKKFGRGFRRKFRFEDIYSEIGKSVTKEGHINQVVQDLLFLAEDREPDAGWRERIVDLAKWLESIEE